MITFGHAIGSEITNGNFTFDADNKLLDSNYELQTTGTGLHIKYSKALFHKPTVKFYALFPVQQIIMLIAVLACLRQDLKNIDRAHWTRITLTRKYTV